MRILSIVTLISPFGEYGGPLRVALNQARELIAHGHEVTIAAAARGFDTAYPTVIDGVPVALYPAKTLIPGVGFAGLSSPALYRALPALSRGIDAAHVHLARDFVTLPAAAWMRRKGIPYVLQTHGMIDESKNPLARPLDAALTRRVLRDARHVFYLTERERTDLIAVAGADLRLHELANGVPVTDAFADSDGREVLYLARLAPRKRPTAFVEAARRLGASFPDVRFRLVGPDEGEGGSVDQLIQDAGAGANIAWEGAIGPDAVTARMARASVYVLPSVDEPYPMSVLEAMSLGLPVVITDSCGLAPLVRESGSGIVVDDSLDALTGAVRRLLDEPEEAAAMGRAGKNLTRQSLDMAAVARELISAYAG